MRPRLDFVIKQEGVKTDEDGRKALIKLSGGDMRRVLNVLQCTHMSFGEVTGENVYRCCGQPTEKEMEEIRSVLMEGTSVKKCFNSKYIFLLRIHSFLFPFLRV